MGGEVTWGPGNEEDECGVSFRFPDWDNTDNYYAFTFTQDGFIYFRARVDGDFNTNSERTAGLPINLGAGATNDILVSGFGDTFTLYINGEFAAEFVDDTFPTGGIAVAMATFDESEDTNCNFDNFWVWSADGGSGVGPGAGPSGPAAPAGPEVLDAGDLTAYVPEDLEFSFSYPEDYEDVAEFGSRAYIYNTPDTVVEVLLLALSADLRDNIADIDMDDGEVLMVVSVINSDSPTTYTEETVGGFFEILLPELLSDYEFTGIETETLPGNSDLKDGGSDRPLAYADIVGLDLRVVLSAIDSQNSALVFVFADPNDQDDYMPAVRSVIATLEIE